MQLTAVFTSLIALATAVSASPAPRGLIQYNVRYDATYDNPNGLISGVACSNGVNGLNTRGYVHFSDLPTFPNLAAWQGISWNSTECGSCWKITHNGVSVLVTAIDRSGDGFNVAEETFKELNNNDLGPGSFSANAVQVPAHECGL
jgi:hypothetical protein